MKNTHIGSVKPDYCTYNLSRVFVAAVADRDQVKLDLESARAIKSEQGATMNATFLRVANDIVDMLEQYKLAGMTHIQTKYSLEDNLNNKGTGHLLSSQLRNGDVKAFKLGS